jgi:hypothetical protein
MNKPEELAGRLKAGLDKFVGRDAPATTSDGAQAFADLATKIDQQLAALPAETRHLLHTADSGFSSHGEWVDKAIEQQGQQLGKLARAAQIVATWLGPDGEQAERVFLIRGNVRGWAHRWRGEDKGTGQVETDPEFVTFATECLLSAGIEGNHREIIEKALQSDWRTVAF